ncbi:MAG: uL30 family ribosomal protein [Candidatus Pacearchaeota archaeon]
MILIIRIAGMVEIPDKVQATLDHMRLRRKYAAILMEGNEENMKLIQKVRSYVAYGTISEENLAKLITLRGQPIDKKKKVSASTIVPHLGKKTYEELGIKPFFRLHPPRGGIETKNHFGVGKGVLGDNKENINKLLEKML